MPGRDLIFNVVVRDQSERGVRQAEKGLDDLKGAADAAERALDGIAGAARDLEGDLRSVGDASSTIERELDEIADAGQDAGDAFDDLIDGAKDAERALEGVSSEARDLGDDLSKLERELDDAGDEFDDLRSAASRLDSELDDAARATNRLEGELADLAVDARRAENELEDVAGAATAAGTAAAGAGVAAAGAGRGLRGAAAGAKAATAANTPLAGSLGTLAALFGAAEVLQYTGDLTELARVTEQLNETTGVSAGFTFSLAQQLEGLGFEADTATTLMSDLTIAVDEARRGDEAKIEALQALGVTFDQIQNASYEEIFNTIRRSLSDGKEEVGEFAAANEIFGEEGVRIFGLLGEEGKTFRDDQVEFLADVDKAWLTFKNTLDNLVITTVTNLGLKVQEVNGFILDTIVNFAQFALDTAAWATNDAPILSNAIQGIIGEVTQLLESIPLIGDNIVNQLTERGPIEVGLKGAAAAATAAASVAGGLAGGLAAVGTSGGVGNIPLVTGATGGIRASLSTLAGTIGARGVPGLNAVLGIQRGSQIGGGQVLVETGAVRSAAEASGATVIPEEILRDAAEASGQPGSGFGALAGAIGSAYTTPASPPRTTAGDATTGVDYGTSAAIENAYAPPPAASTPLIVQQARGTLAANTGGNEFGGVNLGDLAAALTSEVKVDVSVTTDTDLLYTEVTGTDATTPTPEDIRDSLPYGLY